MAGADVAVITPEDFQDWYWNRNFYPLQQDQCLRHCALTNLRQAATPYWADQAGQMRLGF
jgi:hypothetical protein